MNQSPFIYLLLHLFYFTQHTAMEKVPDEHHPCPCGRCWKAQKQKGRISAKNMRCWLKTIKCVHVHRHKFKISETRKQYACHTNGIVSWWQFMLNNIRGVLDYTAATLSTMLCLKLLQSQESTCFVYFKLQHKAQALSTTVL